MNGGQLLGPLRQTENFKMGWSGLGAVQRDEALLHLRHVLALEESTDFSPTASREMYLDYVTSQSLQEGIHGQITRAI